MSDPDKRNPLNLMRPGNSGPASKTEQLLEKLLRLDLIDPLALDALPAVARGDLVRLTQVRQMLARLIELKLLTAYQAERVRIDNVQGLILGNYRVLDRLGVGSHGVVFRGEHRQTGQKVAIKVLIPTRDLDPKPMLRFFAERKAVAQLLHPGIVRALDVGETTSDDPDEPVLYYYVMEHVPGLDLEQHVQKCGPMPPSLACEVAYQVADALTEAHRHRLVHRDIKPSNIILTPAGRAMLLDFGLVRQCHSRQTVLGSLVGMLEWIAPEQVKDAHAVDIRADIYSLGCTLFWCLTAQSPYGEKGTPRTGLPQLQTSLPPPSIRHVQANLAPELEAVVARMMAPLPDDRYADPQVVMAALAPFVSQNYAIATPGSRRAAGPPADLLVAGSPPAQSAAVPRPAAQPPFSAALPNGTATTRILIVDGDPAVRLLCREALQSDEIACFESGEGELALLSVAAVLPDLVLLDIDLPGMTGLKVLQHLRRTPQWGDRKIIMLIRGGVDIGPLLAAGADDYLIKPLDAERLRSRVKSALQFKVVQDALQPQPPQPAASSGA